MTRPDRLKSPGFGRALIDSIVDPTVFLGARTSKGLTMSTTHIVRTALASTFFLALLPGHAGTPVPSSSQTPAMLSPWKGPHGGVPAWSEIQPAAFPAAFATAMQVQRDALQHITANPRPATFANTILALEKSSELLDRGGILFGVHASTCLLYT